MDNLQELKKLAVDCCRGNVAKYSVKEGSEAIRQALIAANNGKEYIDFKGIRDGKCNGFFTLIETLLDATVVEGLQSSDFFNDYVDYRNVAEGDALEFTVEDDNLFYVAKLADGTQAIRRQRLSGVTTTTIKTDWHAVRIYEEMNRILAGRVDWTDMVNKVAESFDQQILTEIYEAWAGITAEDLGDSVYAVAGAYDETALLELVDHVEAAANGQTPTIIGTKRALRKIIESINSDDYQHELHSMGYIGTFYGVPVVAIPQRHKINSTEFVLDDNVITVVASNVAPIKFVYEGNPYVINRAPENNMDLTQEYVYLVKYGLGIILPANTGIGKYEITE